MAIVLERLNLQEYDDGLDGLLRDAGTAARDLLLQEPYWLQVRANMKILIYCMPMSIYSLILLFIIYRTTVMASVLDLPGFPNVETRLYGMFDNDLQGNEV